MNETIEKIHAAFDDAQDWLIREAEKYEEKKAVSEEDAKYADSMTELGFTNTEEVVEIRERQDEIAKSRRLHELVLYYRKNYPLLKFLTIPQLEDICERFNLIYAPVDRYTGKVPKKNLKEIMNAQALKPDDAPKDEVVTKRVKGGRDTTTTNRQGLFIAAPKSDFNLEGLEQKKGLKGYFQSVTRHEPDDPIVFRYVFGGLQVLTKWGPEAEDPALTNPLDN